MAQDPGTGVRKSKSIYSQPAAASEDIEAARSQQAAERRKAKRSPGRVRPDTITHEDRKKINRVQHLDRLAHASIYGGIPIGDISRELKAMSPQELVHFSLTVKQMSKQAERERVEELHKLPATLGFGELSKPLLGLGKPDPVWGSVEALSLFPFGRGAKAAKEGVEEALKALPKGAAESLRAGRTPVDEGMALSAEEVGRLRKGEQVVRALKDERGEIGPRTPKPKAAQGTPEGAEELMGAMGSARRLEREQKALRRVEKGKRAGAAARATEEAGGGEAGFRAARAELRGKYPELEFHKLFESFGEPGSPVRANLQSKVDDLLDFIQEHPMLQGRQFTIDNTKEAFLKALNGQLPQKAEIRLLEDVFGVESVKQFTKWRKAADLAVRLLNVPRSLRASYDLSAPFRQGLVLGARHPVLFAKAWGPMLKAAKSKSFHDAVEAEIRARPSFELMDRAGLKLTDFENLGTREEAYMSDLAERIPLIGRGVKFSARGYVTFLNKLRADAFDLYLEHLGSTLDEMPRAEHDRLLKGIASWINAATGRGGMGSQTLERAAPLLTVGLFSPRLIASRLALLNPVYYARLPPFARKQAVRGMLQLVAAGTMTLWLAEQLGADVVLDPRNSDFGKIKLRDTRIDIWGGFQQYVVNGYRIAKKESVSSTTGDVKTLEGGFGEQSRASIFGDFFQGKMAPVPGYAWGSMEGRKPSGEEFNELKEAGRIFLPLGGENAYEGFREGSPVEGALSLLLGSIGFGTQTYGAKKPKAKKSKKSKSRSIYGSGSSSKSKSIYANG